MPLNNAAGATLTLKFYDANSNSLSFSQVQSRQIGTGSGAYAADAFLDPTTLRLITATPMTDAGSLSFNLPAGQPVAFAINWPTATQGYGLVISDNGGSGYSNSATVNFTYQAAKDIGRRIEVALAARPDYVRSSVFNAAYGDATNHLATADQSADDTVKGAQGQLALDQLVVAYDVLLKEYGPAYARAHQAITPPWLGFTLEDISNYQSDLNKLAAMASPYAWVRIVFQAGDGPSTYTATVNYAKSKGIKVLGLPVDSSADTSYTRTQYLQRFTNFVSAFPAIDAWEVGNEVNGEWLSADIAGKLADAAAYCKSQGKKTYLTLFWQINTASSPYALFNWINANVPGAVRSNLDYLGISQYQEQAPMGAAFDQVMKRLQVEFPNQQIGLGELGYWISGQRYWWAYSTNVTTAKHTILEQYYKAGLGYAGSHGACFWWNFATVGSDFDSTMTNSIADLKNHLLANTNEPVCPTNKTVECGSVWDFDLPTAAGVCTNTNVTISVLSTVTNGLCPKTITRTWQVSDPCGNTNTCNQTVTVTDATPPALTCTSDKTVTNGTDWNFDPPTVQDACQDTNVTVSIFRTVTNSFCPQTITCTWLATDPCGNTNTCGQTVTLSGANDTNPPTVTISAPVNNAKTTNPPVSITGLAGDDSAVAQVLYRLNGGPLTSANTTNGYANWSAEATLQAGPNSFQVVSLDTCGNISPTNTLSFFLVVTSLLTLRTNGAGDLVCLPGSYGTPTNGAGLQIGRDYTITAVPTTNFLFSNWVSVAGSVTQVSSVAPKYTFPMQSNLMLTANFVSNQFFRAAGKYNGLFWNTNDMVTHQSAGFFSLSVKSLPRKLPTFSGKLSVDGENLGFSGAFSVAGEGLTKPLIRKGKPALIARPRLNVGVDNTISGTISNQDGSWVSHLDGDQAVFNLTNPPPANILGNYTFVLPGSSNHPTLPAGDGYGSVTVNGKGVITLAGGLGDGAGLRQSVPVAGDGSWPLYCAAYPYKFAYINGFTMKTNRQYAGSVLGWVTVSNGLRGALSWIKNPLPNDPFYPGGFSFTNGITLLASTYTNSALVTNRIISLSRGSNGVVILQGGNLGEPLTNAVFLSLLNKFTAATNYSLTLSVNPRIGTLTGKFKNPDNNDLLTPFSGVVLQQDNLCRGFFKGTNMSGSFQLTGSGS